MKELTRKIYVVLRVDMLTSSYTLDKMILTNTVCNEGWSIAMAVYETKDVMHSVYFLDCGGHLIGEPVRVRHGQAVQPPAYTPRETQEFLGWSRPTSCVTENTYCVAVTRDLPQAYPAKTGACRVLVLELRGQTRASLFPLGNWEKGETLTREDLACLHLRHMGQLRPFRCTVSGDTILAVTDFGVRAFDTALRPLEGLLGLMPTAQRPAMPGDYEALLAKEA